MTPGRTDCSHCVTVASCCGNTFADGSCRSDCCVPVPECTGKCEAVTAEPLKCSTCGNVMPPLNLDPEDEGLEGFIARELPRPDKAWCSAKCYEEKDNVRH